MSRTARRPTGLLGVVVLTAVLAIAAAWQAQPPPWGAPGQVPAPRSQHAVGATMHGTRVDRAVDLDRRWDARVAAATSEPAGGVEPSDPGVDVEDASTTDRAVDARPLDGARIVPASAIAPKASGGAYSGKNHVWIPSIGLSRNVVLFPCSRKRPPDNHMYRWGCAQRNNVYLLGHAYSAMKPLYDAYMSGRLHVGMVAIYADGSGRIRRYRVTEWRVVDPVDGVHWAIAAQPVPSMTLQTCVGKYSQWRLNVRLVAID
ncbi:MAG TPA: hypothetical protein VNL94_04895 [Candidatus Binatia bacterium]|nr:hypothetical protein [Candidatus Binatia bacterium]